jgi:L-ascorbate metabolism protein UlaG (beta-lactamase superfamily)
VRLFAPAEVVPQLRDLSGQATAVGTGDTFSAAGFTVRAYGGQHAVIHPDIPRIANLGYLLDGRVYHPGDSFDVPGDAEVDTLFVPVSAPWLKTAESIDFIRAVRPRQALALHDALLNDLLAGLVGGLMDRLAGTGYRRLAPGESLSA